MSSFADIAPCGHSPVGGGGRGAPGSTNRAVFLHRAWLGFAGRLMSGISIFGFGSESNGNPPLSLSFSIFFGSLTGIVRLTVLSSQMTHGVSAHCLGRREACTDGVVETREPTPVVVLAGADAARVGLEAKGDRRTQEPQRGQGVEFGKP